MGQGEVRDLMKIAGKVRETFRSWKIALVNLSTCTRLVFTFYCLKTCNVTVDAIGWQPMLTNSLPVLLCRSLKKSGNFFTDNKVMFVLLVSFFLQRFFTQWNVPGKKISGWDFIHNRVTYSYRSWCLCYLCMCSITVCVYSAVISRNVYIVKTETAEYCMWLWCICK